MRHGYHAADRSFKKSPPDSFLKQLSRKEFGRMPLPSGNGVVNPYRPEAGIRPNAFGDARRHPFPHEQKKASERVIPT